MNKERSTPQNLNKEDLAFRLTNSLGGSIRHEEESVLINQVKKMEPSINDRDATDIVNLALMNDQDGAAY